jgi:hypothetical protein
MTFLESVNGLIKQIYGPGAVEISAWAFALWKFN